MSTLLEYIQTLKQPQKVRIKLACECTDEVMDRLEKYLERYDPVEIGKPEKMILQKQPLDFPNVQNAEVHIVDFSANLPVSLQQLHADLARLLRVSEGMIVVRHPDDPRETEQLANDGKEEYKPRLSTSPEFHKEELTDKPADELFGDRYNTNLLKELKKLADERKANATVSTKVNDPDVPESGPEIGDSTKTNTKSPVPASVATKTKGK